jgi:hypothetical protein
VQNRPRNYPFPFRLCPRKGSFSVASSFAATASDRSGVGAIQSQQNCLGHERPFLFPWERERINSVNVRRAKDGHAS